MRGSIKAVIACLGCGESLEFSTLINQAGVWGTTREAREWRQAHARGTDFKAEVVHYRFRVDEVEEK